MDFKELFEHGKLLLIRTFLTYLSMVGLGFCMTLLGAALIDLEIFIQKPLVKSAVPMRQAGYFIGACSGAFMERFWDQQVSLLIANVIGAFALIATPFCRGLINILICIFLTGVCMGLIDTCTNVYIVILWRQNCANFMQVLHLCYGVGSLLIPFLVKPFLLPSKESPSNNTDNSNNSNNTQILQLEPDSIIYQLSSNQSTSNPEDVEIQYPFWIIGGYFCFIAAGFIYSTIASPVSESYEDIKGAPLSITSKSVSGEEDSRKQRRTRRKFGRIAIILFAILSNFMGGVDTVIGSLAPIYGVDSRLALPKSEAATSVSLFWLLFAFFRVPYMFLVKLFGESRMLFVTNAVFISSAFILFYATTSKVAYLIALTVLGIGESPIYAASLGYLQKYVKVSGATASFFMVSVCIGKFTYPTIISMFIKKTPDVFIYILSACVIVVASCLFFIQYICWKYITKRKMLDPPTSGNEMTAQN